MDRKLKDQVAIVTGGARGIGAGIARRLADEGCRVVIWDVAAAGFDAVAAGFGRARQTDTSTSFGIFSCSKASNEMNYLAQKLARQVMGTNNIDSCNRT